MNELRSWDRPTASDWADVLATFPLFAWTSKRRLRELARSARFVESAAGETIAFAGDRNDTLDVILGGRARTLANADSRTLGTGDSFSSGSATIVATSDVHVMKLPARAIERLTRRQAHGLRGLAPALPRSARRPLAAGSGGRAHA